MAAGNFVLIKARGAGLRARIKGQIISSHGFPIVGAFVECFDIEIRVAWRVAECFDNGVEIGLTGAATHGGHGGVGNVRTRICSLKHGCRIDSARVVRVKVHGDGDFFAERFYEFVGHIGFTKACHVFDGEEVSAELF